MSIVKIQNIRRLDKSVDYIKREDKTNFDLISTSNCDVDFIVEDFNMIYEERKNKLNKNTNNKAKMIMQSFDFRENITPNEAHKIGKELAENYLGENHQYIIATHTDTNNIHNHIIFNEVRLDNLLMFDTTRRNTIDKLRLENDKLSRKYGLIIPKENSHEKKIHYINQREMRARKRGNSFKEKLENTIDEAIYNSNSYEDFLNIMKDSGYVSKEGMYLAFLNDKTNKYMRSKTLGINYNKNSIKYRIKNKDLKINKYDFLLQTEKIDLSQDKFRKNRGLRKWGSKQNIKHLQEISNLVFNKNMTLEEINKIQVEEEEFVSRIEQSIEKQDRKLHDLEKKMNAFKDYSDSYELMVGYKKSNNKKEYKKRNYQGFIKHDKAKKNIYLLKRDYGIENQNDLLEVIDETMEERNHIFYEYTHLQNNREKEIEKEEKEVEQKREKGRKNKFRL